MKNKTVWIYEDIKYIKVDGEVYVRVKDIQEKLSEIRKFIKEEKKGGE